MINMIIVFFKIGFISFGGGWTVVGLLENELVKNSFMTLQEFKNALSLSQMTPGPIAINLATYVGYKNYGFLGAFLNTFFFLLPTVIMYSLFVYLNKKYFKLDKNNLINSLKLGAILLISQTLIRFCNSFVDQFSISIMIITILSLLLFVKTKISPIFIILFSGVLGIILIN